MPRQYTGSGMGLQLSGPPMKSCLLIWTGCIYFEREENKFYRTIHQHYDMINSGRTLLLPVAWIHRFFKTHESWGAHAREVESIMNTDEEEVLKLKRIYKEIGL